MLTACTRPVDLVDQRRGSRGVNVDSEGCRDEHTTFGARKPLRLLHASLHHQCPAGRIPVLSPRNTKGWKTQWKGDEWNFLAARDSFCTLWVFVCI